MHSGDYTMKLNCVPTSTLHNGTSVTCLYILAGKQLLLWKRKECYFKEKLN